MKPMKRSVLIAVVAMMAAMGAQAQKVVVVDTEGNGVPYASVMTAEAEFVGVTDLNGVLADAKGNTDITVTHVAYKPKQVKVSGDTRVVLEDAGFALAEITVQPKPLVYVQTYYRLFLFDEKDGMAYYRAGLTDNVYDREKKKVSASTDHAAKAKYGILKTILGMFGSKFDTISEIKAGKLEDRMIEAGKPVGLTISDVRPGRKQISDRWGTLGLITDGNGQRRFSYDAQKLYKDMLKAEGKTKKLEKAAKKEELRKNMEESLFTIFRIDEDGNYAPEDFVAKEFIKSFDELKKDRETGTEEYVHYSYGIQVFTIERAYVTKNELKQKKKDNKMKMNYQSIQQFERQNNIPPLAPPIQKKLAELWKVSE